MVRDGDFFLLSYDPLYNRAVWVADRGDEWEFRTDYYDVEASFDANADFEKSTHGKPMGDWVRIASVPEVVAQQAELDTMLKDGNDAALSRWFNDSDHRKFRTSRGRF